MSNRKITKKQQEILNYIKQELQQHGYPPSVREICQAVSLKSTSSVHAHLESLERNGFIRRDPAKPRAIELIEETFQFPKREVKNIPILANEDYSMPFLSDENIRNYFPVPAEYVPNEDCFLLQAQDNTMKNVGIFSGSYVLIDPTVPLREGDFAVVMFEEVLYIRTYCMENGRFYFCSETDVALPTFPAAESHVIGKVTGMFHFFPYTSSIDEKNETEPEEEELTTLPQ